MSLGTLNRKLLFIDDDKDVLQNLTSYFSAANHCFTASNLAEAKNYLQHNFFDAIILDLILPDGDGLQILKEFPDLPPVVILSSLGAEVEILSGFSVGAADYVVKPCSPQILDARLSLRLLPPRSSCIEINGIKVNSIRRTAQYNGVAFALTSSEFNILFFLMKNAGNFFSAREIYENIWQAPIMNSTTIRYHISNLRHKLISLTGKNLIITAFDKGYAFDTGDEGG